MSNSKWYVGTMNDGYFVIDKPPQPAPVDYCCTMNHDVNVIAACGSNEQLARLLVSEHNAGKSFARFCCNGHNLIGYDEADCPLCQISDQRSSPEAVEVARGIARRLRSIPDVDIADCCWGDVVNTLSSALSSARVAGEQQHCDHCSADLNGVRHILCETDYRKFAGPKWWDAGHNNEIASDDRMAYDAGRVAGEQAVKLYMLNFIKGAVEQLGVEAAAPLAIGYLQSELGMTKPLSEVRKSLARIDPP